jgi:hypothetical protein
MNKRVVDDLFKMKSQAVEIGPDVHNTMRFLLLLMARMGGVVTLFLK